MELNESNQKAEIMAGHVVDAVMDVEEGDDVNIFFTLFSVFFLQILK